MPTVTRARPDRQQRAAQQRLPGQRLPGQRLPGQRPSEQDPSGQRPSEQGLPGQRLPRPRQAYQQCRVAPSALALLTSARHGLAGAACESGAGARYVAAHLAALRAAAAIVAARSVPGPSSRRRAAPRSVWELLPRVEPALGEWAAFFAAGAGKRAAAEAGLQRAVTGREADDLLRDAETFVSLAEQALGVGQPGQAPLPLRTAG